MNRRTFLTAATSFAGLALAPAWSSFQQRREIDLQQFCDDYWPHRRYDISKPFAQGASAIGTDGRILVRTTLAALPEVEADRRLPNLDKLTALNYQPDRWYKWPREAYVGAKNGYGHICPFCAGKGGTGNVRMCQECEGEGYALMGDEYEAPCKACQKSGYLWDSKCSNCNGSGSSTTACYQLVGKVIVASHYDAMIRRLGDVQVCFHGTNELTVVKFRGDGFDGLLMPLTVTEEEVNWN